MSKEISLKVSRLETLTRQYLKYYFPEWNVVYNLRPDFLFYYKRNLELDIYYPDLEFAVEVQGVQHKIEHFAKRDRWKFEKCEQEGILVFYVWGADDLLSLRWKLKGFFESRAEFYGFDFSRLEIELPHSLFLEIRSYKPKIGSFGGLTKIMRIWRKRERKVKRRERNPHTNFVKFSKDRYERAFSSQEKEIADNRKRNLARAVSRFSEER